MSNSASAWALMRSVSPTLDKCRLEFQQRRPIDLALARRQHELYADTLRSLGLEVTVLPERAEFPDACFVEDTAVVMNDCTVICRMGAESRRGEEADVRQFLLAKGLRVIEMESPATADGGDVLIIDNVVYIGRSLRTNRLGAEFLAEIAKAEGFQVHFIAVEQALHLKTVCSHVGEDTIVCHREKLGEGSAALDRFRLLAPPRGETAGCNVVRIRETVLVPAGGHFTQLAVERAGFATKKVDIGEFHKAEAGLTCLSLRSGH